MERGFSLIELMVAMTIATLTMTGVVVFLGGDQSLSSDTGINVEALHKAQDLIEKAAANARLSYATVSADTVTDCSEGLCYTKKTTLPAAYATQCKQAVVGTVSWTGTQNRSLSVSATTTIVNIPEMLALGGDCDFTPPSGWTNPDTATSVNLGGQGANDIDAAGDMVYITSDPSPVASDDFFAYEFDPTAMTLTLRDSINLGMGVNRADIAGDYAYIANASTTNSQSSDELLVLDISDPTNIVQVGKATLGLNPNCPTFCPGGAQAIKYYNGRVYIGTHRINGDELSIYDVSDPTSPTKIRSFNVNHNVNDIAVSGSYAYLATSNDAGEIMVYNIADPGPITLAGVYNTNKHGSDTEDARRLFIAGNRLYFGRDDVSNGAERDFYILDISSPASPVEIGSYPLTLNPNTFVTGVVVKGALAFVAADDPNEGLQILNVSDPANIVQNSPCSPVNFAENASGMDVGGNYIFLSSISNDEIRVFHDAPGTCSP